MDANGRPGRGPSRDRDSGGNGGPPRGEAARIPVGRGTTGGRGAGNFGTDLPVVRPYPVDPVEQYTYIGHLPSTRVDRRRHGYYQDNGDAIGLGTVIRTTVYEYYQPELGRPFPSGDPSIMTFATDGNESCLQKIRRFIVIDRTGDIFIALPIYTYGGRGLEGKPDFYRSVHLHVRDLRREPNQTEDQILASEDVGSGTLTAKIFAPPADVELFHPQAHCRFNYPVTFNLLTKWVQVLGRLTEFSAKKLFVRHHQDAARRLAPPQLPATNNVNEGDDDGNDNDDAHATGRDSNEPMVRRTSIRRQALGTGPRPRTPSRSPQGSAASGPALSGSPTRSVAQLSISATRAQTSPGLRLTGLALTSPGKRRAEGEANDRSSSKSSKRQNRSSGSSNLMELDDVGRPRRQPQSKSRSAADPGTDYGLSDIPGAKDTATSTVRENENPQNLTRGTTLTEPINVEIDSVSSSAGKMPDTLTPERNGDRVGEHISEQVATVTATVYPITESQRLETQHAPINNTPETIRLSPGSTNFESPFEREIALMRAAYVKQGDRWTKDRGFILRALSSNGNKLLNRIGELKALGISDQEIEDDLVSQMGFPGSIGTANSTTELDARSPMPISAGSSRIGQATSARNTNMDNQADGESGMSEENVVRLMRAFKYTRAEAIAWNRGFGGNLVGALDTAMSAVPHMTEEQVAMKLRPEMNVWQAEIRMRAEIEARRGT